jgi:virginiamycin A acetyltransferase
VLSAPNWFRATPDLLDFLRERRIFTRLQIGDRLRIPEDAAIEPYSNIMAECVLPRAIGAFSYTMAQLHWELSIGRYCSLAPNVAVMGSQHPTGWVTTSPFSYHPAPIHSIRSYLVDQGATSFLIHKFDQGPQPVTIGHDVWIGSEVLLKRGISVGTGAVIAARSVVTKDVPPYAVVAGTPARIVRYRFPEDLIARMLASRWWDYGPDILQPLDVRKPESFLARLEEIRGTAATLRLEPVTGDALIAKSVSES